jgi:UDP-glucose 4-epimerase
VTTAEYVVLAAVLVLGLVAGVSAFKSHVGRSLETEGDAVGEVASGSIAAVRDRIRFEQADLRVRSSAREATRGQEVVFHLAAAHGGRGYIETHPVECMNNMALDHELFAAACAEGVRRIVTASSACAYPIHLQASPLERMLLRESDAGFDAPGKAYADGKYGWAKLMGELQLRAFSSHSRLITSPENRLPSGPSENSDNFNFCHVSPSYSPETSLLHTAAVEQFHKCRRPSCSQFICVCIYRSKFELTREILFFAGDIHPTTDTP